MDKKTPGVIWLLPIVFGVIGGVVAALIVGIKYRNSWWQFLVVGIVLSVISEFILSSSCGESIPIF